MSVGRPAARNAGLPGAGVGSSRFPFAAPGLSTERFGQKIVLQRQLTYLGVQLLDIRFALLARLLATAEHVRGLLGKLLLPLLDLVWMHLEALRQLCQRSLLAQSRQRHLCLESRRMIPSFPSHPSISFLG